MKTEISEGPGVLVTIKDLLTGETKSQVLQNDWMVITAGNVFVDGENLFRNGTAVITIKREAAR